MLNLHMHARGILLHTRMLAEHRCGSAHVGAWCWASSRSQEPEGALPGAQGHAAWQHPWQHIQGFCEAWHACRWVIRFMGGAWCWDRASCRVRSQKQAYLMSTAMLPADTSATAHQDGIPDKVLRSAGITSIEAELNPFYSSWAHVHIWYCSSDSHLSDIAPGAFGSRHRLMSPAMLPDTKMMCASPGSIGTAHWNHVCALLRRLGHTPLSVFSASEVHS